jgi:RNA polymerase sigma-70 factor (ECF subfamily)
VDDRELLSRVGQGDVKSFGKLIDRYSRYVTAIVCRVAGTGLANEDIEEVASDVFIKIWQNRESIVLESDSLRPYLAKTAKNMTLNKLRNSRYRNDLPLDLEIGLEGCSQDLEQIETMESINSAINRLDEPDRELFIRRYVFSEPVKSLAERFELNRNTVATKHARARKKLAQFWMRRRSRPSISMISSSGANNRVQLRVQLIIQKGLCAHRGLFPTSRLVS